MDPAGPDHQRPDPFAVSSALTPFLLGSHQRKRGQSRPGSEPPGRRLQGMGAGPSYIPPSLLIPPGAKGPSRTLRREECTWSQKPLVPPFTVRPETSPLTSRASLHPFGNAKLTSTLQVARGFGESLTMDELGPEPGMCIKHSKWHLRDPPLEGCCTGVGKGKEPWTALHPQAQASLSGWCCHSSSLPQPQRPACLATCSGHRTLHP